MIANNLPHKATLNLLKKYANQKLTSLHIIMRLSNLKIFDVSSICSIPCRICLIIGLIYLRTNLHACTFAIDITHSGVHLFVTKKNTNCALNLKNSPIDDKIKETLLKLIFFLRSCSFASLFLSQ